MTERDPREEYEFYEDEENLRPQGPPRRRESGLTEMLPVRVSPSLMDALRDRAKREERSVSWVVRRAIERYLDLEQEEDESEVDQAMAHVRAALEVLRVLEDRARLDSEANRRAREELRDWLREVRQQIEEAELDPRVVDEAIAAAREIGRSAENEIARGQEVVRKRAVTYRPSEGPPPPAPPASSPGGSAEAPPSDGSGASGPSEGDTS